MKLLIAFLCCAFLHVLPGDVNSNIHLSRQLSWLPGTWEFHKTKKQVFTENWQILNDSTLVGKGAMKVKGKEVFSENLQIRSRGGKIFYVAQVSNHNKGKEIEFELKDTTGGKWTFENLRHHYPQRIAYMRTSQNALHARIEAANKSGKIKGEDFYFKRAE